MVRKFGVIMLLSIFLAISMVTGNSFASDLPNKQIFSDVTPSHWAYSYIHEAYENGYIHGDGSGKFRPDDPLGQIEFLVMLSNAYPKELSVEKKASPWYAPYVDLGNKLGLSNIRANPSTERFTRGDLAVMIVEVLRGTSIHEKNAVQFLLKKGISNGKTSSTYEGYHPDDTLTRAEALTFLMRVIEYVDKHQDGRLLGYREWIDDEVPNVALENVKIGWNVSDLVAEMGEPDRILVTADYYDWYVYNKGSKHLRYAVYQDQVVGLFSNSKQVFSGDLGIEIGVDTRESVRDKLLLLESIYKDYLYTDSIKVIIYYDQHADYVVDMIQIIAAPKDHIGSRSVDQERLDRDNEWGIFYLTNSYRAKHISSNSALVRSNQADKSAYLHSKDMYDQGYFDHTNRDGLSPFDRMKNQGIRYGYASENIAFGYADDIEVMNGWINSLGHRNNLLNKNFTHLGVGVYKKFYTQNFYSER